MSLAAAEPALPLRSRESLCGAFEAGLIRLSTDDSLGAFILACANANAEPLLHERLSGHLAARFEELLALRAQRTPAGDDLGDDEAVFAQLAALGFCALLPAQHRRAGRFEIQFNQLRSFRPSRGSTRPVVTIRAPFDPDGFHFNREFLRKEVLWAGPLLGTEVVLLYNKYPFVAMHGLLVPQPQRSLPQYLDRPHHDYLWSLTESLAGGLPGIGFGYNAFGAFSSVNHLHFHFFVRDEPLPVESPHWRHNGGREQYPGDCVVLTDAAQAWAFIEELHAGDVAYNLLYRPGRLYALPRRKQGSYRHSEWTCGFSWYEMAGGVITFQRSHYESLDEAAVARELARTAFDWRRGESRP